MLFPSLSPKILKFLFLKTWIFMNQFLIFLTIFKGILSWAILVMMLKCSSLFFWNWELLIGRKLDFLMMAPNKPLRIYNRSWGLLLPENLMSLPDKPFSLFSIP